MIKKFLVSVTIICCLFSIATVSDAQTSPPVAASSAEQPTTSFIDEITFDVAPYAWLSALNGRVGLKGVSTKVNLSISDVLDNLEGGLMTAINLHYKDWSFNNDLIWAELSGSASTPRDLLFSRAKLTVNQIIWTPTVGYRAYYDDSVSLELNAGFRLNSISNELNLSGALLESKDLEDDQTWIDPIIGFRSVFALPNDMSIRVGGDIGGFGAASELTWQAWTILGYELSNSSAIGAGYRALGYDYDRDGFLYNVDSFGPFLGGEFRF
jgi:hypothetical protein